MSAEFTYVPSQAHKWFLALSKHAKIILIIGASVPIILLFGSCSPSEAHSIERVLAADDLYEKEFQKQIAAGTSEVEAVGIYARKMRAMDLSGCPIDFSEAYFRYFTAWREMAGQIQKEPGSLTEGFFMGLGNTLTGELDGGKKRLTDAHEKIQHAISAAWTEVEGAAVRHGAKLK